MSLLNNLLSIFDVESLLRFGGLLILFLLLYGSTGLFFCFFIPAGAFLFTAGVYIATGGLSYNIYAVCGLLVMASVLGNATGYWFGWKAGPLLYKRKDSKFFKKQHLVTARSFYEKYGWMALTLGLFLPVIRSFAPVVAGIIKLDFRRFLLLVLSGSVLWILSFVFAGYAIGRLPLLKPWLNYIVGGFIIIVTVPLAIWVVKELKRMKE